MEIHDNMDKFRPKSDYIYIISGQYRPGVASFMTRLEYENYIDFDEEDNSSKYDINVFNFCGLPHIVIGIPMTDLHLAENLCDRLGLKLQLGKPSLVHEGKVEHFPLDHSTDLMYTIEYSDPNKYKGMTQKRLHDLIRSEITETYKYVEACYRNHAKAKATTSDQKYQYKLVVKE